MSDNGKEKDLTLDKVEGDEDQIPLKNNKKKNFFKEDETPEDTTDKDFFEKKEEEEDEAVLEAEFVEKEEGKNVGTIEGNAADIISLVGIIAENFTESTAYKKESKLLKVTATFLGALGYTASKSVDPEFDLNRYEINKEKVDSLLSQMIKKDEEKDGKGKKNE